VDDVDVVAEDDAFLPEHRLLLDAGHGADARQVGSGSTVVERRQLPAWEEPHRSRRGGNRGVERHGNDDGPLADGRLDELVGVHPDRGPQERDHDDDVHYVLLKLAPSLLEAVAQDSRIISREARARNGHVWRLYLHVQVTSSLEVGVARTITLVAPQVNPEPLREVPVRYALRQRPAEVLVVYIDQALSKVLLIEQANGSGMLQVHPPGGAPDAQRMSRQLLA
jgi:hypothetical protein